MNQGIIDNVVSKQAFEQLEKLKLMLSEVEKILGSANFEKLSASMGKFTAEEKKLIDMQEKAKQATLKTQLAEEKLNQERIKSQQQEEKLRQAKEKTNTTQKKGNKLTDEEKAAKREAQKISKLQAQVLNSEAGSVNQLSAQYRLNRIELNKMSAEQRKNSARGIELTAQTRKIKEELISAGESVQDHTLKVGRYTDAIGAVPGPMGRAASSVRMLGTAFKALIANPVVLVITAIVGALAALTAAFKSADTGATAFASALKAIKNVVEVVIDRVASLAKSLISLVKLDFQGFKENAKDAFGGVGDAIRDAARAGWEYEQQMDRIKDAEAASLIRVAKLKNEIADLREVSKDQTRTYEERVQALTKALQLERQVFEIEKGFAEQRLEAEKANLAAKIQNATLTDEQKRKELERFLSYDDKEIASALEKDKAFALFYDNNEEAFQNLQKQTSEYIGMEGEFTNQTRRMTTELSRFRKEMEKEPTARKEMVVKSNYYDEQRAQNQQRLKEITDAMLRESLDGELNSYDTRLSAARDFYDVSMELLESERKEKKQKALQTLATERDAVKAAIVQNKNLYVNRQITRQEYEEEEKRLDNEFVKAEQNYQNRLITIGKEATNDQIEEEKRLKQNLLKIQKERYQESFVELDISQREQSRLIKRNYDSLMKEYEKASPKEVIASAFGLDTDTTTELLALQHNFNQAMLENERQALEEKLKEEYLTADDRIALNRQLNDTLNDIEDDRIQYQIEQERYLQKEREKIEKNIVSKSVDTIKSLYSAYFDWYDKKLDSQSEKQNEAKDKELSALQEQYDQSLISKEDFEARKASIEQQSEKRQAEIEKKREQSERRQFLLEQTMALAKVWINAALKISSPANVMGVLTPYYLAEAVTATALIAAQSIPYFEEGGEMKETGLAVVGEKRKEVVLTPRGEVYITPDTPTLVHLERGSTVFPDASNLNNEAIAKMVMVNAGLNFSTKTLEKKLDKLIAIEEGKTFQLPKERLMDKLIFARKL